MCSVRVGHSLLVTMMNYIIDFFIQTLLNIHSFLIGSEVVNIRLYMLKL